MIQQNPEGKARELEGKTIIQQILCFKYHDNLVNYRYQLAFDSNYSPDEPLLGHADGTRVLSQKAVGEFMLGYVPLEQTIQQIRKLILGSINNHHFAPILSPRIRHSPDLSLARKRYLMGLASGHEGNTMNTELTDKGHRSRETQLERGVSRRESWGNCDVSSQLSKVGQDLSRVIQSACVNEQKKLSLNMKLTKCIPSRKRQAKSKEFRARDSIFRPVKLIDQWANYYPQEDYGLKNLKREKDREKEREREREKEKEKEREKERERERTRQVVRSEARSDEKKKRKVNIRLSPLTPKPVSISKNWGWIESKAKKSKEVQVKPTSKEKKKVRKSTTSSSKTKLQIKKGG